MELGKNIFFWKNIFLYLTLHPQARRFLNRQLVRLLHGLFTPPRISPSCLHCLCLWLGRSIIVLCESHRNTVHHRLLLDRCCSLFSSESHSASSQVACPHLGTSTENVIQKSEIQLSNFVKSLKLPSLLKGKKSGFCTKVFLIFINFFKNFNFLILNYRMVRFFFYESIFISLY